MSVDSPVTSLHVRNLGVHDLTFLAHFLFCSLQILRSYGLLFDSVTHYLKILRSYGLLFLCLYSERVCVCVCVQCVRVFLVCEKVFVSEILVRTRLHVCVCVCVCVCKPYGERDRL